MTYTKDGIMAQILVAFGQGTGFVRVSHDASVELRNRYYDRITPDVIKDWEIYAVQVLERIRALGRLMASNAIAAGETSITGAGAVSAAARIVEVHSQTNLCGGPPTAGSLGGEDDTPYGKRNPL
jgi:hypothetical protein